MLLMTFIACAELAQDFHPCFLAFGKAPSWSLVLLFHIEIKYGIIGFMDLALGIPMALSPFQIIPINRSFGGILPSLGFGTFLDFLLATTIFPWFTRRGLRVVGNNDTILCNYTARS